jgi:DNA-binding MarR family transcriptional regulator
MSVPAMPRTGSAQSRATTQSLGFLLAKAATRWNELLVDELAERGFAEVRASYGSVLLPLFEEDGLRMGPLAARGRLAKQTLTSMVRQMERDGLVRREPDPADGRASRVFLTERSRRLRPAAETALADLEARVAEHMSAELTAALRRGLKGVMNL